MHNWHHVLSNQTCIFLKQNSGCLKQRRRNLVYLMFLNIWFIFKDCFQYRQIWSWKNIIQTPVRIFFSELRPEAKKQELNICYQKFRVWDINLCSNPTTEYSILFLNKKGVHCWTPFFYFHTFSYNSTNSTLHQFFNNPHLIERSPHKYQRY